MLREVEEHKFPYRERRKLIFMLTEAGFVIENNSHGQHVYVCNPKEDHAKIGKHHLPVAFLTLSSYWPLNQDEPSLKEYHEKIKESYDKIMGS